MTQGEPDSNGSNPSGLARAADLLRPARRLLFITGAGLSADSGLPTYRGIGGLYDAAEPEEGLPIEELLSGSMLASRPELTWRYIHQIERACRGARFNGGHEVIAMLETRAERVCVLTQNVDGFHHDAGSSNVIDIHGDLHDLLCTACDHRERVSDYRALVDLPLCARCNQPLRPDVVLFGELLPPVKLANLYDQMQRGFDLVCSIGTSSLFPYIAGPVLQAARAGIPTIEINPGSTEVSNQVDLKLTMGAADALGQIWQMLSQ